jgi:hypothetical protein
MPTFHLLIELNLHKTGAASDVLLNSLKVVGQLTRQATAKIDTNASFFKEIADKNLLETLLNILFSEDKSSKLTEVKFEIIYIVSTLLHPKHGELVPFPWVGQSADQSSNRRLSSRTRLQRRPVSD